MRLMFLPPYSPEPNPAEHLWKAIREDCFANQVFTDLDAVETALTEGIASPEANPSRTQSMTGFGWIASISLNATQYQAGAKRVRESRRQPRDEDLAEATERSGPRDRQRHEVSALRQRVAQLEAENADLRQQVQSLSAQLV